nr:hypothetical protein [uncultured Allomuricauda sp.]
MKIGQIQHEISGALAIITAYNEGSTSSNELKLVAKKLKLIENNIADVADELDQKDAIVSDLSSALEKLEKDQYTQHLPPHMQSLRMEMALKTFFENIEILGVEGVERVAQQLTPASI